MLVLSRKVNESIQIGDVTVTVTRLLRHKVSLGIEAPTTVNVKRGELREKPDGSTKSDVHE